MDPRVQLLETLVKNRNRVLTSDELRRLVWSDDPSRQVLPTQDVNALYVPIKLRAALGDAGKWIVDGTISSEAKIGSLTASANNTPEDVTPFVGTRK